MAILLTEHNWLLLHPPRTGGTWRLEAVRKLGLEHEVLTPRHSNHIEARIRTPEIRVACFVRNSEDWLRSWWRYCNQPGVNALDEPDPFPPKALPSPKDQRWGKWRADVSVFNRNFVSRMFDWYMGPEWDQRLDFIGHVENLQIDFEDLLADEIGIDAPGHLLESIGPINTSPVPEKFSRNPLDT